MANFTIAPSEVVESSPIFNNIITEMESMKKEFLNLSTTSLKRYTIKFNAKTTAVKDSILLDYNGRYGGHEEFIWASVPAHVNSGANLTGRWIDNSIKFTPVGYKMWNINIQFEVST